MPFRWEPYDYPCIEHSQINTNCDVIFICTFSIFFLVLTNIFIKFVQNNLAFLQSN
jgi:hypothetical protein